MTRMTTSTEAFFYAMKKVAPLIPRMLEGQKLISMGRGLVAQLLSLNIAYGIDVRTNTALIGLIGGPDGRILGARVRTTEGVKSIGGSLGVLLAAGGIAHNGSMRDKYMLLQKAQNGRTRQ